MAEVAGERSFAVENLLLLGGPGSIVGEAEAMMKKLPDLERKITRIHAFASVCAESQGVAEGLASQKRAVGELVSVLQVLSLSCTCACYRSCPG